MNYQKYLTGSWHIIGTTFNMWLKGNRTEPSITYSIVNNQPLTFLDQVRFRKNNKMKSIEGYDKLKGRQFVWSGKGILKLIKSKWEVVYLDSNILVIQFDATLLTSSGMDILLRDKQEADFYKEQINRDPEMFNLNATDIKEMTWLF